VRSIAEVRLWETRIGAVSLDETGGVAAFQYDPHFLKSGIEVAPLMMPLSSRIYRFPELPPASFHGLPGLLADALPDRFGSTLIDAWLATQGRTPQSFDAVERLCYMGTRGTGALEFAPAVGPEARTSRKIEIDALVALASEVLSQRSDLQHSFADEEKEDSLRDILRVGTSAGGARAKAVIAWNPATNAVHSGQVRAEPGFEYWILKFDGVTGNRDRELDDPKGYGAIEYAYYRMARIARITMMRCRLFEEGGRRHFMTRRFDRLAGGEKLHLQSLAALAHYDFNAAGAHSYEQAFQVIRRLGLGVEAVEEQFRRMVFNVVARNQDDHVKNIAFLMNKEGRWTLSPAFDLTYSYNPAGAWTWRHQMSLNGKRDHFTLEDLRACANSALMKRGRAEAIYEEVRSAVLRWPEFAGEAKVPERWAEEIRRGHRVELGGR